MGNDFFDDLGETITRTAREIGERADAFLETQKLRNKISAEQRMVNKRKMDIGTLIFQRYLKGEALDEELASLCDEISCRRQNILSYQEEAARRRGEKICPCCGASVDREAAYCPKCGTACSREEEKEEEEYFEAAWENEGEEPPKEAEEAAEEKQAEEEQETSKEEENSEKENSEE